MAPKLFGCVITSVDEIIIIGQPSVGLRGAFCTYRINSEIINESGNDFSIEQLNNYSPKDGHVDDGFGISCKAIRKSENRYELIVGSHRHFENGVILGAAYIYSSIDNGKTWLYTSKMVPNKHIHKSLFGCSVDINSHFAVVGAFCDNTEGWRIGAVYMFKENESNKWVNHRIFYPNVGQNTSMNFGFSLALSGNLLAVGAPSENSNGSVYLYYSNDEWEEVQEQNIKNKNRFGFSVELNEETLVVGAPGENGMSGVGYSYDISNIFDISYGFIPISSNENQVKTLTTNSRSSKSLFGRSISLNKDFVAISGFGKTSDNIHIGSVFLFKLHTIEDELELLSNMRDSSSKELFGHNVHLTEKYIFVGDPSADKVHVYIIDELLGKSLKKWHGSKVIIESPQSYSLELN